MVRLNPCRTPARESAPSFGKGICHMPNFNFVLLYVENPQSSAAFYADLLGRPVIDSSPGFAMLPLSDSVMLGLWLRNNVEPAAVAPPCADWKQRGLTIIQQPVQKDFGRTFVATDPDGHRLRVLAPTNP